MVSRPGSRKQRVTDALPVRKERSFLLGLSKLLLGDVHDEFTGTIEKILDRKSEPSTELFISSYQGLSPEIAFCFRQVAALFTKNVNYGVSDREREQRAFSKWLEAEEDCRRSNVKFQYGSGPFSPAEERLIFDVQRKITTILGPRPNLTDLNFRLGPGSSVGIKKKTSARRKFSAVPTISANAYPLLKWMEHEFPHWLLGQKPTVCAGELHFVPKDAAKFRSIVIEPVVNTFLQLGIGDYLKTRLKRAGCDLRSQETNRDFARFGSISNLVATIDLSSASDTISREVVKLLLPDDWYQLLDVCRTRSVTYNGLRISQHKFSSMGNGYTFELESLIFFAIAKVICANSDFVSVYGDDIIVPSRYYQETLEALRFFGFTPNASKSFSTGPFRESCGKDFLAGTDVRPCYVRERLNVLGLFRLHNFFKRRFEDDVCNFILRYIPRYLQFYGPDGQGDGHLIGDWSSHYRKAKNPGWQGGYFRTWVATPITDEEELPGDFCAALYGQYRSPDSPLLSSNRTLKNLALTVRRFDGAARDFAVERGGYLYRLIRVYTWLTPD